MIKRLVMRYDIIGNRPNEKRNTKGVYTICEYTKTGRVRADFPADRTAIISLHLRALWLMFFLDIEESALPLSLPAWRTCTHTPADPP